MTKLASDAQRARQTSGKGPATPRPTHEGHHDADNHYYNSEPYKEVSAAHRGRRDAAEPQQRRDDRNHDQNKRIIYKVSGHVSASPGLGARFRHELRLERRPPGFGSPGAAPPGFGQFTVAVAPAGLREDPVSLTSPCLTRRK